MLFKELWLCDRYAIYRTATYMYTIYTNMMINLQHGYLQKKIQTEQEDSKLKELHIYLLINGHLPAWQPTICINPM